MSIPTNITTLFIEALFGGPSLAPRQLEEFMQQHGLPAAAFVYALPEGESLANVTAKTISLRLHPGTVYWFAPIAEPIAEPPASELPCPRPRYSFRSPSEMLYAIQQAILILRRNELATLREKSGEGGEHLASASAFTLHDEIHAFQLALMALRKGAGSQHNQEQTRQALDVWCEIVLLRYQTQVNLIRLKLVELLTALTRGHEARFAYVSASLIKAIYAEHQLPALARLVHTVANEIVPLVVGRQAVGERGASALSPPVQKALAFMEHAYTEPVSLNAVAKATHVSPAHLARLFKKEMGHSVLDHFHRLRINHARELLATSDLGLLEVALESGFESIEHFHRLFRRLVGTTPRLYRLHTA